MKPEPTSVSRLRIEEPPAVVQQRTEAHSRRGVGLGLAAALAVGFVGGCGVAALRPRFFGEKSEGSSDAPNVPAQGPVADAGPKASPTKPGASWEASGYVVAKKRTTVAAEATGRIVALLVSEGDTVAAGQLLARLHGAAETTRVALAQRAHAAAQLRWYRSKIDFEQKSRQYARDLALREQGMVSIAAVDQSLYQMQLGENSVASAAADIEQERLNIQLAESALRSTQVRAPFAGKVVALNARVGEIVSPLAAGGFTRSGICTIVDMSSLTVEFDLPERLVNGLRLNQRVSAAIDAATTRRYEGQIIAIGSEVDRVKGTVSVEARLSHLGPEVRPEMSVRLSPLP